MDKKIASLRRLQEIVETLRGPDGCPWDRKQTIRSLRRNFLEESCEVIDAIESNGDGDLNQSPAVCEELGDLLMNIFLAARIAEEEGGFDLEAVATRICEKLVYRHPHVFGSEKIDDVDGVLSRWEALKKQEKAAAEGGEKSSSQLDRVPRSLPPLTAAHELSRQAAKLGFDWKRPEDVLEKIREEIEEVEDCLDKSPSRTDNLRDEIGDLLFAVVNLARKVDISPDEALRSTSRKFYRRFQFIEKSLEERDDPMSLEEMEKLWQEAKRQESNRK